MSFKVIFIVVFLCCSVMVFAQPGKQSLKDSLLTELAKVQPDSSRQKLFNQLGDFFLNKSREKKTNIDSAFYYLRKSVYMHDSANANNNEITNRGLSLLAAAYCKSGNIDQVKKICQQVIKSYQLTNNRLKEADAWNLQGLLLYQDEVGEEGFEVSFKKASFLYAQLRETVKEIDVNYLLAFRYFRRKKPELAASLLVNTIKVSRGNDNYGLMELLMLFAQLKRYNGSFNEALAFAMEALETVQQANDTLNANHVYGELALEYEEMNAPEKSIYWYKKCLEERVRLHFDGYTIYRTAYLMTVQMVKAKKGHEGLLLLQTIHKTVPPVAPIENAILSQSLANCYNAMGLYANAEKYFLEMIKIFDKIDYAGEVFFIANFDIGKFYITQKQYSKAEPHLNKAFANAQFSPVSRIKDLYLLMFKVDSAGGNYLTAIGHYQKYKSLDDSLFNQAKSKQIEELNIKYEVEKKQQNLTILQKENIVQQKSLKQERLTRNLILVGVVLLVLFAGLLYNRYQLKQRANKQLEASREKIEKQNLSLQHLVKEKEWLLKEIHHRVKNNLHTISGLLDAQSGYLQTKEALTAIGDSQHRVQAMSLLHQKLFHSESLSTVEMPGYIHELVDHLEHSFGTQRWVKFNLDIDNLILGLSHALPIGLILNEAITNAIKYAFPGKEDGTINIRLKQQSADQYLLSVADNGKGLAQDFDFHKAGSMGLTLMQGLSEDIGGIFSIKSNGGTEINMSFAYEASTSKDFSFQQRLSSNS
jgi:two-component system, sensor histidine kinase PdtaS